MSYPTPLIYVRYHSVSMPSLLDPALCNPNDFGIQISNIPLFQLSGTPILEFAVTGKSSHKDPVEQPVVEGVKTPDFDNPWTLQGTEISVYLDLRTDRTQSFNSNGTTTGVKLVFRGDIHEIRPVENNQNPWYAYVCTAHGLLSRAERVSVVSPVDSSDTARFNINALSAEYEPATGGKSIGEAIQMLLEEYGAAYWLNYHGLGEYTMDFQLQTATLPDVTLNDLRQLKLVTPFEFRVTGDNIVAGIQQALDAYAPNYMMLIQPDGVFRFIDIRTTRVSEVDFANDLADKLNYSKSTVSSYSKVIVRGAPKIAPVYVQWDVPRSMSPNPDNSGDEDLFAGDLIEQFDYTGANNQQAKYAFKHDDYQYGRPWISKGSVAFTDQGVDLPSNQIKLTPASGYLYGTVPSLTSWGEDHLLTQDDSKQTRRDCRLTIERVIKKLEVPGVSPELLIDVKRGSFLITKNTAVTNGYSIVTTAPNVWRTPLKYQDASVYSVEVKYELYGNTPSGSSTWRVYKVQLDPPDPDAPAGYKRKLATLFIEPAPVPKFSNLSAASSVIEGRTWSPLLLAEYRQKIVTATGTKYSYTHNWIGFRIDTANDLIVLDHPSAKYHSPNGTYDNQVNPIWGDLVNDQPFKYIPYNIKAILPVFDGRYEAVYPPEPTDANPNPPVSLVKSAYGIDRELAISLEEWQDGRDQSYAEDYAKEIWDSVQRPMVNGGFVWFDEFPATWNPYSIEEVPDTDTEDLNDTKPSIQAFQLKAVPQGDCDNGDGTGIENIPLIMTTSNLRFGVGMKPTIAVMFATSKPRLGPAMQDFHSFQERMTEMYYR